MTVANNSRLSISKLLATTMLTAAGLTAIATPAHAMNDTTTPTGEQVVGGSASFDRPSDGVLNINQNTDRVVINWDQFNIGSKAITEFFQPGSHSLAVNRVTGAGQDPTKILGTLKANGQIMVLDRNGVLFGKNSIVDVGGIIASTGDISNADAMDGDGKFNFTNFGRGKIVLNGSVTIADAGVAAFVSPFVSNNGVINAKLGKVAFAAGQKVTLDLYGDDLIEIAVNDKLGDALLKNAGKINAEGGEVIMTAQAAKSAVDNVINMSGVINVSSIETQGGKIILKGGEQGKVSVSGGLYASGKTGGIVTINGQSTSFTGDIAARGDHAKVEVSGGALALGGSIDIDSTGEVNFDPTVFTVDAGAATTLVTALSGGGTVNVTADQQIIVNSTIDSSAQANAATLNFHDADGGGLQVDLNAVIKLGALQNLTGEATTVNVASTGLIQNGVDVAATNATVNVAAGTYNEVVLVNKGISLKGANAGISGNGVRGAESKVGSVDVTVTNASLDGFAVTNGVTVDNANGVTITNNFVNNPTGDGILVTNGTLSAQIIRNAINNASANGIHVNNVSSASINGNVITNAVTTMNGVYVEGGANSSIGSFGQGNTIIGGQTGIRAENTNSSIWSNTLQNQTSDGIAVSNLSGSPFVFFNTITGSGGNGLNIQNSSGLFVLNNAISGTTLDGVLAQNDNHIYLSGNAIHDAGSYGIDAETLTNVGGGNTIVSNY